MHADKFASRVRIAGAFTLGVTVIALAIGHIDSEPASAWPLKPFPSDTPTASPTPKPTPAPNPTPASLAKAGRATPTPVPTTPDLYVRGNLLAISHGYLFFTAGNAVRLAPSVVAPAGANLGHAVRVTLDQVTRTAVAVDLAPRGGVTDDIDASQLPAQYAALSPAVPTAAPAPGGAGKPGSDTTLASGTSGKSVPAPISAGPVTVQFNVTVPGNTPPNDDIFIATDRSNFSPAEIRMQRSDPQHWTASLTIPGGAAVHYEYTRGTYSTVERDRFGGIIEPRAIPQGTRTDDTIARWADLN